MYSNLLDLILSWSNLYNRHTVLYIQCYARHKRQSVKNLFRVNIEYHKPKLLSDGICICECICIIMWPLRRPPFSIISDGWQYCKGIALDATPWKCPPAMMHFLHLQTGRVLAMRAHSHVSTHIQTHICMCVFNIYIGHSYDYNLNLHHNTKCKIYIHIFFSVKHTFTRWNIEQTFQWN